MQKHQDGDRLSWGDTVFLHLEREGMPLNVAYLCVFDGEIPFEDCLQFVESKLPLIPRYLKRVVPPPFNVGHSITLFRPQISALISSTRSNAELKGWKNPSSQNRKAECRKRLNLARAN
jgi:hypothetical protein